jgi:hypothetical protein
MASLRQMFDRFLGREPEPPRFEPPKVKSSEELLADLEAFTDGVEGKLPDPVASRVERVASIVRDTIPRLDRLGAGSYQAHSVVATATSYLPEAVGAYLRLPRSWADSRPVSGGKTSMMLLCDQLDLLAYTMGQVLDAILRADAAALVAHGAFLQEKFGTGSLTTPESSGPAGTLAPPEPS